MKYQQYESKVLKRAVNLVRRGRSLGEASKETGVPRTTIRDHSRGRYHGKQVKFGGVNILTAQEEGALSNYVTYMTTRGFPLQRKNIRKLACGIVKTSGKSSRMNFERGPSDFWMRSFLKRHPELTVRVPHTLEKARAELKKSSVVQYFDLLHTTLKTLNLETEPTRIFNCDESGFSGKEFSKGKVVVPRGTKHPYQQGVGISGHITVHVTVSASGRALPPMLIFNKNLPRGDYKGGLPDDWMYAQTDSGYINSELFLRWFRESFVPNCGRLRPVLLIMDNHVSHLTAGVIDAARQENIELLCLPSHSTHLLQPLDVGYFHLLKQEFGSLSTSLGYTGMRSLPRNLFPKILQLCMNKIRGSDIASAFAATGIVPYKPSRVLSTLADDDTDDDTEEAEITTGVPASSAPVAGPSDVPDRSDIPDRSGVPEAPVAKLVKLGLIPECLQNVLVDPPKVKKPVKKRKTLQTARVITSVKPTEETSAETVEADAGLPIEQDSQTLCDICMTGSNAFRWIGCDVCELWIHYECVSERIQRQIDVSLSSTSDWVCFRCAEQ